MPEAESLPLRSASAQLNRPVTSASQVRGSASTTFGGVPRPWRSPLTHCTAPKGGTPPNVVEADPRTWLALVTGRLGWDEAQRTGRLSASGTRTGEVRRLLPLT